MLKHISAGSIGEYGSRKGGGEVWVTGRGLYCTTGIKGSHLGHS